MSTSFLGCTVCYIRFEQFTRQSDTVNFIKLEVFRKFSNIPYTSQIGCCVTHVEFLITKSLTLAKKFRLNLTLEALRQINFNVYVQLSIHMMQC